MLKLARKLFSKRLILVGIGLGVIILLAVLYYYLFIYPFIENGGNLHLRKVNQSTAKLNGFIGAHSLATVKHYLEENPETDTLIFGWMPGSLDDDANIELARYLHQKDLTYRMIEDSDVNSGATDLFLSAKIRTIECGAVFGVHSWADDGDGDEIKAYTAQDLPRDPSLPDHALYIDYFREMGLPDPVGFYFFTVDAAPAGEIYPMTPEEINQYGIATEPMSCSEDKDR